jgi:hypothetical protein
MPPNPATHPFWIPEFFGDAIIVNGKTMAVSERRAAAVLLPHPQRLQCALSRVKDRACILGSAGTKDLADRH